MAANDNFTGRNSNPLPPKQLPSKPLPPKLGRDEVVRILEGHTEDAREALAARKDAGPEVLYFLAAEGTKEARRAVAANPAAPAQANRLLANDNSDDVRVELARKIGRLMPDLSAQMNRKLRNITIETLQLLAKDALPRVRQALAEEIKHLTCIPKPVIDALARDVEIVSAPILEYSPLLSDADLIDLVTTAQAHHVVLSIAKRAPLSGNVCEAIAKSKEIPAVALMLANSRAEIRERTLEKIAERASRIRALHEPLIERTDLSPRLIRRIAGFVSASLVARLAARHHLDDRTRNELNKRMRLRIDEPQNSDPPRSHAQAEEARALFDSGKLDDHFVMRAAETGKREAVVTALSLLANVSQEIVNRILMAGQAKPVVSLVWRAGLGMRAAFKIQSALLRLPARELLPAREGVRFPLTEEEMRWHLGFFEVQV